MSPLFQMEIAKTMHILELKPHGDIAIAMEDYIGHM